MAANRTSPLHEATLQANWLLQRIGRELRLARIAAGMTQQQVALRLGSSDSAVSRAERGGIPAMKISDLHRHASAVGLKPWIRLYPGGRRVLDAPQLALLGRLRDRLSAPWEWHLEAPVPIDGDLRAADALLELGELSIAVEAITRLSDVQAQVRAAQLKRRDIGATRLVLLVAASTANRAALREAQPILAAAFLIGTRRLIAMLSAGLDPGGNCLIVL